MKITFRKIIKAILPYGLWVVYKKITPGPRKERTIQIVLSDESVPNYYGQCAEDVLLRLFLDKPHNYDGFYIDIGAFHPASLSNTKYFYDIGWNGINIDANPSSIAEFNKVRPRDINIASGVSDEYGELDYYYFGETASINTFIKEQAKEFEKKYSVKIQEVKKVIIQPINIILEKNVKPEQHIDFISIDVEGFEMKILKSFDFQKYGPDFFLIEDLGFDSSNFKEFQNSPLYNFMKEKGYTAIGKTELTILFASVVGVSSSHLPVEK